MITEIDSLLETTESFNTQTKITEAEDISLEDIEGMEITE